jgi:hypothetical protein
MKTIHLLLAVLFSITTLVFASETTFVLFGKNMPRSAPENTFVSPISAPYFHEDAMVTTDVRAWHVSHAFDADTISGATQDVAITALQLRLALTPRLQFVAYKDGYTSFEGPLPGAEEREGWNDLAAGLKWAFFQDPDQQLYAAVGVGYEIGIGEKDVLQDTEDYRIWASINKGMGRLHLGANINHLLAEDRNDGLLGSADMVTVHLHADYFFHPMISPVVEVNAYFVTNAGEPGLPFSGVDAGSLGGGEDEDTYTGAFGLELRPAGPDLGLRVAYETELSDNVTLFGDRWTFSAIYRF